MYVLKDSENGDMLLEHEGIIVARIPAIVEEKWPGIAMNLARGFDPSGDELVPLPRSVSQAELMEKIGFDYIKRNAPERLSALGLERAANPSK